MTGPWDDYRKGREYVKNDEHKKMPMGLYHEDRSKVGWSEKSEACWFKKRKDGSIIPLEKRNRDHQIEKKNCVKVNGCNNQNDQSSYYDLTQCPVNGKIANFDYSWSDSYSGGEKKKSSTSKRRKVSIFFL